MIKIRAGLTFSAEEVTAIVAAMDGKARGLSIRECLVDFARKAVDASARDAVEKQARR